jgi:hypothetical protein
MGISPFSHWKSCSCYYESNKSTKTPEAPNPNIFTIKQIHTHGKYIIVLVNYPNCTNYEGNKICVYSNKKIRELVNSDYLDPHFDENDGPIARFEPTNRGWKMAVSFVKCISGDK